MAPLGNPRSVLFTVDHVGRQHSEDGDEWIGGPGSTAVDAAAAFPEERLERNLPGVPYHSTGVTEVKGRVGRRFANARSIGGAVITGHNLTQTAVVRYLGGDFVFGNSLILDGSVANVLTSTTSDLTATAAATFRVVCLIRPIDGATDRDAETWFYFGTDGDTDNLFDVALRFRGTGNVGVLARISRYDNGTPADLEFTSAEIDDGATREYIIRVADSTTTAEFLIDGGVVDSTTSAPTLPVVVPSSEQISIGTDPCRMEIFSVTRVEGFVLDEDLPRLRRFADEYWSAEPHWLMDGSGVTMDDSGPGSHTGTVGGSVVRGVEIAESLAPFVDTGSTEPWGDWSAKKALEVGATGDVEVTVSENVPRSATMTWWVKMDLSRCECSTFFRMLHIGATAATSDIEFSVSATIRIGTRRAGGALITVTDEISDGEWHFCRVVLEGRTPTISVSIDGSLIGSGSGGTYATAASWTVNVEGNAETTGFQIADVRVYGYAKDTTEIDYRATAAPWDDRELLVELPFDGTFRESISGAVATNSGALSFIEWPQQNPDSIQRGGAGQGVEAIGDATRNLPPIIARDFIAPQICQEVAALLWDPALADGDGFYEADVLRFLHGERFEHGRSAGVVISTVAPDSPILPGGPVETVGGARYRTMRVDWPSLTNPERDSLLRLFHSLGEELPCLLISVIWSDDSPVYSALWATLDGQFTSTEVVTEISRGRHAASVTLKSLMAEPFRL